MGMAVMMGMIAMLVMVMLVAAMIMGRAIMRRAGKRIAFRRMHMVPGIGAAFGIERRFDLDHARPEPLHHRLDDVIAPEAQALDRDIRRQVIVIEMPGNP